ncbi:LysR family transcriptional regulator [Serratia sarumanii]|uniref:LysR family transcriptional regulator n=1 Tax=Serratia sarumanii TaxID=3020826 RepID=UPI003F7DAD90
MNKSISVRQLEILVKIFECGGISGAARQLNISPSAISKNLSSLERQLGVTLVNRTTRTLNLTEVGEYMIQRSKFLLDEVENVFSETAGFYNQLQGELKITSSIAFGYSYLSSLSKRFRQNYSDVNFNIILSDNFFNLNEGNCDVAIRIASVPPEGVSIRKLCLIRWVYCATPEYLDKAGVPRTTSDLVCHSLLTYPGLTPTIYNLNTKARIQSSLQANSSLLLFKAALEGQGIAYLPTYLVGDYIMSGHLTLLHIGENISYATHNLYAIYFPSKYRNPKVRAFIDFIANELCDEPEWDRWI